MSKKAKQTGVLFGLFLGIFIVGLFVFFQVAEDFYTATVATAEGIFTDEIMHKKEAVPLPTLQPEKFNVDVKYRTFFLTVPSADKVELAADFNRFGKDPIVLKPYKKGYFETSVALAGGEYKYYFLVDGQKVLDPTNMDRQLFNGEEVCIKTVR